MLLVLLLNDLYIIKSTQNQIGKFGENVWRKKLEKIKEKTFPIYTFDRDQCTQNTETPIFKMGKRFDRKVHTNGR